MLANLSVHQIRTLGLLRQNRGSKVSPYPERAFLDADKVEYAVERLHREFFIERDPELFEILREGEEET